MYQIISDEGMKHLRDNCLPKDAHPMHRLAEQMAFADTARQLPRESLIQIVGLRDKNIAWVAAAALNEFHTCLN